MWRQSSTPIILLRRSSLNGFHTLSGRASHCASESHSQNDSPHKEAKSGILKDVGDKLRRILEVESRLFDLNKDKDNKNLQGKMYTEHNLNRKLLSLDSKPDAWLKHESILFRDSISSTLLTLSDVSLKTRNVSSTLSKFFEYRDRWRSKFGNAQFVNESVFKALLELTAKTGTWSDVRKMWRAMKEERMVPKPIHYSYALIGLERSESVEKSDPLVAELVEDLKSWTYPLEKLCDARLLRGSEIQTIERVLKILLPGTELNKNLFSSYIPSSYSSELLKGLNLKNTSSLKSPLTGASFSNLVEEQIQRESSMYVPVPSVIQSQNTDEEIKATKDLISNLKSTWKSHLEIALTKRLNGVLKGRENLNDSSFSMYLFFCLMNVRDYANVAIEEISELLGQSQEYTLSVKQFEMQLGTATNRKFETLIKSDSEGELYSAFIQTYHDYLDWLENPQSTSDWSPRDAFQRIAVEKRTAFAFPESVNPQWPFSIRVMIGRELLNLIMNNLSVDTDKKGRIVSFDKTNSTSRLEKKSGRSMPLLFRIFRKGMGHKELEDVKPLPQLAELFGKEKLYFITFKPDDLPMVVPPIPWINPKVGGYLVWSSNFLRASIDSENSEERLKQEMTTPVFDSLNQLGNTPWIINKELLSIITDVFVNQSKYYNFLNILKVPMQEDVLAPPKLDPRIKESVNSKQNLNPDDLKVYKEHKTEIEAFQQFKSECYSLWCDALYRLSIANHFKDNVLFFPHNIDFRGRVYPISPYLNHMGNDLARSLLVFAEGKPLGSNGLDWLKLHTINLTGLKKRDSIADRLKYANEVLDLMLDSARRPFEGSRWWLESDEPWQTLAGCIEIRNAIESGDPENYISHFPIHQDGSCNGLQHYAALGRDVLGARAVNLLPSDVPQDVYSEIAAVVERKRKSDASKGVEIAKTLDGYVSRKILKQTVMTTVYGVTPYGAKLQIAKKLKDSEEFPLELVNVASVYLANKTFESLNELFHSSQKIQAWFTMCADVLASKMKINVEWETPLGLHVIQPYYKILHPRKKGTSTLFLDPCVDVPRLLKAKPNVMKNRNGFPPNFVHSLDSSHMILTSLHMWNVGCTFASVHDCYWTHACHVEIMNKICREQFVNLHSYPILENLSRYFCQLLENHPIASNVDRVKAQKLFEYVPAKGKLVLEEVKKSPYFFS